MSYIDDINDFWDLATISRLSSGQIALWFALKQINNKCNWIEWFTVSNQVLSMFTNLSRSGILKARNELKQRGFIDFKTHGTKATSYKMLMLNSKRNSVQDSKQVGVQEESAIADSKQDSVQDSKQVGVQDGNTLTRQRHRQDKTIAGSSLQSETEKVVSCSPEALRLCEYFEENCRKSRSAPLLNAITQTLENGAEPEMVQGVIDRVALGDGEIRAPAQYVVRVLEALRNDNVLTLSAFIAQREQRRKTQANGVPTGQMQDWEQDWLAEVKSRRKQHD